MAASVASIALSSGPAFGQTVPRQPIEYAFGSAIKTSTGVAGSDPRLISYYSRVSAEMNTFSGGQGASWLRTLGRTAKGLTGLAGKLIFGRVGQAIMLGSLIWDAAATIWSWYQAEEAEKSAIKTCAVGGACRITNSSGVTEYYTHTIEGQSSSSNFSLYGARGGNKWSAVITQAAPTGSNYTYDVWWKYIGSGAFDPNYVVPTQTPTSTTGLTTQNIEDLLRAQGDAALLDKLMFANVLNALNAKIAADPATSSDVKEIADMITAKPITTGDVGFQTGNEPRVSDLVGVTPTTRPISIGDPAIDPSGEPTPTPTATATGGTTTLSGPVEVSNMPDMTVPALPDFPEITPVDWWPNPFTAPTLDATCVNPGSSLASLGNVTIPLCDMVDLMAPVLRPLVAGVALVGAGKIILDV
jgi:hypothetical protein